jgi:hypothetical protein
MGQWEFEDDADLLKNKHTAHLGDAIITGQIQSSMQGIGMLSLLRGGY